MVKITTMQIWLSLLLLFLTVALVAQDSDRSSSNPPNASWHCIKEIVVIKGDNPPDIVDCVGSTKTLDAATLAKDLNPKFADGEEEMRDENGTVVLGPIPVFFYKSKLNWSLKYPGRKTLKDLQKTVGEYQITLTGTPKEQPNACIVKDLTYTFTLKVEAVVDPGDFDVIEDWVVFPTTWVKILVVSSGYNHELIITYDSLCKDLLAKDRKYIAKVKFRHTRRINLKYRRADTAGWISWVKGVSKFEPGIRLYHTEFLDAINKTDYQTLYDWIEKHEKAHVAYDKKWFDSRVKYMHDTFDGVEYATKTLCDDAMNKLVTNIEDDHKKYKEWERVEMHLNNSANTPVPEYPLP